MNRYTTIEKNGSAIYEVERSKFIANISRVESREEALAFISSIKEQYKDATHNVPCFVIGEHQELVYASDDKEPSGTAGMPIANLIQKEGLTNVCIVVTRYFGGIKLGTGGLSRAYTAAAKLAIDDAGRCIVKDMVHLSFKLSYPQLLKLQNLEKNGLFQIENIQYLDDVLVQICLESEEEKGMIAMLSDLVSKPIEIIKKFL